jgi:RNA polymerase sigma factor (sigma-70 family)
MRHETEIGGAHRMFEPTLWSMVFQAKDGANRRQALEQLITLYWKPVYFYLRRRGYDVEACKDITQGFFTAFLERDFLKYVQRERGKFRTFLLTALDHFLADEYDKATAVKRGGRATIIPLDFVEAEREIGAAPADEAPENLYRREWARLVMDRALERLRKESEAAGRAIEFTIFREHLGRGESPSYADLAARLGVTETDVRNRLNRARIRFREALLEEIRAYTTTPDEAREELRDLFLSFR